MVKVRSRLPSRLIETSFDAASGLDTGPGITVLDMPHVDETLAPIAYTVPLQLLAYHVAVAKGTDVDQPRNLAKSVTVE